MNTFRNNPDGEENQQATKESASYVGGLKLQQWDTDRRVLYAMQKFGGSFVKALAHTAILADSQNRERIKDAFPEYWSKYTEMAKSMK